MHWMLCFAISALLPGGGGLPGIAELDLAPFVTRFLRETSWMMWFGALGAALLFVVSPVITIGWPLPAFLLPAAALDRHAHQMGESDVYVVRQCAVLIKTIGALHWAAHPAVRPLLGLEPYGADPTDWRTT